MSHPARAMLCDRTREWVALRLDGELSEIETAIMSSHLERCEECRSFADDVAGLTREIRSTPLHALPHPVQLALPRRLGLSIRQLQVGAAAALVVVAAGLGSVYGAVQAGQRAPATSTPVVHGPMGIAEDDVLLRKLRVADLRPTGPLPLGATKPPLEVSV